MEHAVHLGSQKFIKIVSPTTGSAIIRKVRRAVRDAKESDTFNIDQLDAGLEDCENVADGDDCKSGDIGDDDDDDDFDTGDACGKALALVKQVCFVIYRQCLSTDLFTDTQVTPSQGIFQFVL